ncbi:TnsA endonuclease N-terminal domain-containing protein [Globicatella sanguinis]
MQKIQSKQQSFKSTRKFGNNRVLVYSKHLNRRIEFHSTLEYLCFLNLEFLGYRDDFINQPDLNITLEIEGELHRSRPDFLIVPEKGRKIIVECKHSNELEKDKVRKQLTIQKEWARINNYEHQLFTELDAKKIQTKLTAHIKLLGVLVRSNANSLIDLENYNKELISYLSNREVVSIEEIKNHFTWLNENNILLNMAYFYHKGVIKLLLNENPLSNETEVEINER